MQLNLYYARKYIVKSMLIPDILLLLNLKQLYYYKKGYILFLYITYFLIFHLVYYVLCYAFFLNIELCPVKY